MTQRAYKSGSAFPELTPGRIRLYSSRVCPYAARSRLILYQKNIPHEIVNIDLLDKPEWFLEISPMGKVPVYQHDDKILYESMAISEYLDDVFPGDKLQPQDPYQKAWDRIMLESYGKFTTAFYKIVVGLAAPGREDDVELGVDLILKAIQYYEDELAKRNSPFFGGTKPSMIDFIMWPHFERIPFISKMTSKVQLTKETFPKIAGWFETMTKVPAVQKEMHDGEWFYQVFQLKKAGKNHQDHGLEE